ncbi:MAG: transketolase [Chloroflexi bacterium]|nr:transketolase [Chloroflexota bacterium]
MLYAFRDTIYALAQTDKRIILICTDQDIGLHQMQQELPNQYYMEGISEANIIGMATGLAAEGFIPFIVNHASFITRRCYEQIALDACLQERPIRLIGMGSGLATAHLGPTHTATEDIAIMRAIPNMTVVAPCDADEMKRLLPQTLGWPQPIYIRLARYGKPIVSRETDGFTIGKAILLHQTNAQSKHILFIATGAMTSCAVTVAKELEGSGFPCAVLHVHTIKPLDRDAIIIQAQNARLIVTMEDHTKIGGLGSACIEALIDSPLPQRVPPILRMGLPDQFIHQYGTQESLLQKFGLEASQIVEKLLKTVLKEPC